MFVFGCDYQSGQVQEAIDQLFVLEKQTRNVSTHTYFADSVARWDVAVGEMLIFPCLSLSRLRTWPRHPGF